MISLLDKYVLDYDFNNFDAIKDSKLIVFKKIRNNWIEKNIEKIGIIKNKKYLLDYILENNYSDKDIEIILNVFQFEGNDDEINLKKAIYTLKKNKFDSYNIFNLMKEKNNSYTELFNNLYYYISFFLVYEKEKNVTSYSLFLDLSIALLSIGWSLKEIGELFDKKIDYKKLDYEEFKEMLEFIKTNKILYSKLNNNYENLIDILNKYPPTEWEYQLKNLLVCDLKPYDFYSLIEEIYKLNNENYTRNDIDEISNIIIKIKQRKFTNLPETDILIKDAEINNIQNYFSSSYYNDFIKKAKSSQESYIEFLIEILAIVNRAVKIFTQGEERLNEGYELRDVQLIAIVLILLSQKNKGVFAQIKTGQGKSIIIAVLAVVKSLFIKYVDILTSSIELASRDSKELKNFYKIFNLNVSCANEENPYIDNVVYTDTQRFEGEILDEKFHERGKRLKNKERGFRCLIIDEVDSICVDNLSASTLLTFHPKGFGSLQILYPFFNYIYNCITFAVFNNYYCDITKEKKDLRLIREKFCKGVKSFLENNNIRIPNFLKSFIENRIHQYASSLQSTFFFDEKDVQYKVMENEIKIVDNLNTGVVHDKMKQW